VGRTSGSAAGLLARFSVFAALAAAQGVYQQNLPIDNTIAPDNRVERLIREGAALPDLRALLAKLDINIDSQMLVFSRTSFQAPKISPRNPRAIYFNDDVAVGWVRGSASLEIAATDPRAGAVFYTLTNGKIERSGACLRCHHGAATLGVPGIFVGSVFAGPTGDPYGSHAIVTDHRTKFEERWGGWYVTGTHGDARHRGNAIAPDPAEPETLETEGTLNLTKLDRKFDASGYLAPTSDLVALMVFEHQTMATNLITRVAWEARLGREADLAKDIDALVRYLTFADEAPLPAPVRGVSTFAETFSKRGPGREFDLRTRLFRSRVSYMIHSAAFAALPAAVRERVWGRL
jgi:hypothetical protein